MSDDPFEVAANQLVSALFEAAEEALASGLGAERVASAMRLCADHTEALVICAPTIADVVVATVVEARIPRQSLTGAARHRAVVRPRQIAMTVAYEETGKSQAQIGAVFGGRDHTTVFHARRAVGDLIARGDMDAVLLKNRIRAKSIEIVRERFSGGDHARLG